MTQSGRQEIDDEIAKLNLPSFKEKKCWLCYIGFHKWEMFSTSRPGDGLIFTFNQCRRDCPRYNSWVLVDMSYWWE